MRAQCCLCRDGDGRRCLKKGKEGEKEKRRRKEEDVGRLEKLLRATGFLFRPVRLPSNLGRHF